ncbi:uncharacterized protein [Hyperolius riggenbachi]|uniref:uncharacterized protein isoform X2 n=1 Tax=Hyperolius riggenbachi TaxID=752182 RepID=UPI0035A2F492
MENQTLLRSPGGSSDGTPAEISLSLLPSQISIQEDQGESLMVAGAEHEEEKCVRGDELCIKEEIPPEIITDPQSTTEAPRDAGGEEGEGRRIKIEEKEMTMDIETDKSRNRNSPERSHSPLYSWDPTDLTFSHHCPGGGLIIAKAEEAEEMCVRDDDPCKEEDISAEISTEPAAQRPVKTEDDDEEKRCIVSKDKEVNMGIGSDESSNRSPAYGNRSPLCSWDPAQEDHMITHNDQDESLIVAEAGYEEKCVRGDELCKKEEIPPEINTDSGDSREAQRDTRAAEGEERCINIEIKEMTLDLDTDKSSSRNSPERRPSPLYSWDHTEEDLTVSHHCLGGGLIIAKAEDAEEMCVRSGDPCKEENISAEISTEPMAQRHVKAEDTEERCIDTNDQNINMDIGTVESSKRSPVYGYDSPLSFLDPASEDHMITQDDQGEGLILSSTGHEEKCVRGDELRNKKEELSTEISTEPVALSHIKAEDEEERHIVTKDEEINMGIGTDESRNRSPAYGNHSPLCSWNPVQGDHMITQDDQGAQVIDVKMESEDTCVKSDEPCKEDSIPPEIRTEDLPVKKSTEQYPLPSPGGSNSTFDSAEENPIAVNLHPLPPCTDLEPTAGILEGSFIDCTSLTLNVGGDETGQCSDHGDCFPERRDQISQGEVKPYSCSDCGKYFSKWLKLRKHQRFHSEVKPYACATCGKCFRQKITLTTHSQVHTAKKPFSCSRCKKCFSIKEHLRCHEKTHTRGKPYSCSECGKSFSLKACLTIHQKSHAVKKPFSCSVCGRCYIDRWLLVAHHRIHTGDRPYLCCKCGRGFAGKSDLVLHQRAHTSDCLYICADCGKSFSSGRHLIGHRRTHSEKKPYPCSQCERGFIHKSSLIRHKRDHTVQEIKKHWRLEKGRFCREDHFEKAEQETGVLVRESRMEVSPNRLQGLQPRQLEGDFQCEAQEETESSQSDLSMLDTTVSDSQSSRSSEELISSPTEERGHADGVVSTATPVTASQVPATAIRRSQQSHKKKNYRLFLSASKPILALLQREKTPDYCLAVSLVSLLEKVPEERKVLLRFDLIDAISKHLPSMYKRQPNTSTSCCVPTVSWHHSNPPEYFSGQQFHLRYQQHYPDAGPHCSSVQPRHNTPQLNYSPTQSHPPPTLPLCPTSQPQQPRAQSHHTSAQPHYPPAQSQHAPPQPHYSPAQSHHAALQQHYPPAQSNHTSAQQHYPPAQSHYAPPQPQYRPVQSHRAPPQPQHTLGELHYSQAHPQHPLAQQYYRSEYFPSSQPFSPVTALPPLPRYESMRERPQYQQPPPGSEPQNSSHVQVEELSTQLFSQPQFLNK